MHKDTYLGAINAALKHGYQTSDLYLIEQPTFTPFEVGLDCVNIFEW